MLAVCTALALAFANSPWSDSYEQFWNQTFRIGHAGAELAYPLWYWINDALMAVFFFVIGLEIKRELVIGELRDPRRVVLPIAAAVGGVVAPVCIYLALQHGQPGQSGWAIPMATDIAFVVGCLAILGQRVPHGLKVMMLSLAIVDDMMAVVVIALFYTSTIKVVWAAAALLGLLATVAMNRAGVRAVGVYGVVGAAVWLCSLKSGIHPTVAGVLLGLLTPTTAWIRDQSLVGLLERSLELLRKNPSGADTPERRATLSDLAIAVREAVSPLVRLETALHPWVAFAVMPLFALANAAVAVSPSRVAEPVAIAVMAGLFIGKPLGIFGASWLTVRLGWAARPTGVSWPALAGAACLGGIGFTMAIFIATLSVSAEPLASAKAGILTGSLLSLIVGMGVLRLTLGGANQAVAQSVASHR